jgi:hypothetical protein
MSRFDGDSGRIRNRSDKVGARRHVQHYREEFINPYPWMARAEAMVHLYLEEKRVPFSWRFFDGEAIHFRYLMRNYHPEFTLRECRIVIVIIGTYQVENIPGILDTTALAITLLEQDGWKVGVLYEAEILNRGAAAAVEAVLPELRNPWVHGPPRPNPYGRPSEEDLEQRRRFASALSLRRKQWFQDEREGRSRSRAFRGSDGRRQRSGISRRTRRRREGGGGNGGDVG